jgi:dipeptidyl aminopeptidase/acylaminoacyl peptidase
MKRIEAADYHDLARVDDPQLSPTGERVAFVRQTAEDDETTAATIHVVPIGGDEPRQFTASDGVDSQPRWSPDETRLAFASIRGEDDRQQLWVLPTTGGEARQATSVVGGVGDVAWSPDGSRVLFTQQVSAADREEGRDRTVDSDYEPETPDPRVIDRMIYRAGTEYFDGRRNHVYVLNVDAALEGDGASTNGDGNAGEAITRLTDGDADHVAPTWGDDETVYYATKTGEEPDDSIEYEIVEHDLSGRHRDSARETGRESDETEVITRTTGWLSGLDATTDGRIAFEYTPEERSTLRQTNLRVHDRETGTEATPTEPLDRTIDHKSSFEWGPDGERLYFTTPDEGSKVLWSVPGDASEPPAKVYGDGATVESFSVGPDAVAFVQSEWDHPGDVFITTRGGNELTRLTRVNESYLNERAVCQPEELWVESDGAEIQGWVLTPPDFDPNETYPLVVEIHGGPHSQWTTSGTMWHEFQTLAAHGYVVFWSNPRGSTGYGEAHASAIERDWGNVTLTDVLAGVDAVCEREYVDDEELYVTGGSFGGFMTAWTVTQTDRFRAAVSQRGVYDLTSFYGSTDAFKLLEGDFDTTPWEEPEFLWKQSPAAHVANVETPTLVLHADRDYRTPANTAELFYLGLKKHGVETRLVRYPREGHELSRSGEPGHVVDRIERIARWFDGYSAFHEAPPALEREPDADLSAGADSDDEAEAQ